MADVRISAVNSIQSIDQWLKVLAGNLTGSNVIGYRQQRVEFGDVLSRQITASAPSDGRLGSTNSIDVPLGGTQIKATKTDFSQGSLQSTGQAADLGIQGDGFFILSKQRDPDKIKVDDLVFTRNGSFHFDFFQKKDLPAGLGGGATNGEYRLINQDGLFVLGMRSNRPEAYTSNAVENLPGVPIPPREIVFPIPERPGNLSLKAVLPGIGFDLPGNKGSVDGGYTFEPITIPFQNDPNPVLAGQSRSLNANFVPGFNSKGWVQVNSDAPGSDPLNPVSKLIEFVALAKFSDPSGLKKLRGGSEFGWSAVAGQIFLGVAGEGDGPIGKNNTLNPGSLETSNSSVNTTLPELTIAQKSFTANVKIVQVGNNTIDDVNNLIR